MWCDINEAKVFSDKCYYIEVFANKCDLAKGITGEC